MDFLDRIENNSSLNKTAYTVREESLTYRELKDKSDALAAYMLETLGRNRKPVIVYGHKNSWMPVCFLACAKSGHPYIPVDTSTPAKRLTDIAEQAQPAMILDTSGGPELALGLITVDREHLKNILHANEGKRPDAAARNKGEDVYYIIFTSGSTGKPKGVRITCNCLQSFITWFETYLDAEDTVFLNQAPFSFDLSVMDTYLSLVSGATLCSIDKDMILNMPDLFAAFQSCGITTWVSTPSFAEMCLQSDYFNASLLPQLKKMFFCGETLAKGCAARLFDRFPGVRVYNAYGPTEATVAVTAVEITRDMAAAPGDLPAGYVKEGCSIFFSPQNNEIEIVGDSVAAGYLGAPGLSKEKFFTRMLDGRLARGYRTGDFGWFSDGLLYYGGRLDNQVKLHGYRVEMEDVENNIKKLPFVKNAVVLPQKEGGAVSQLTAVVVPREHLDGDVIQMVKSGLKEVLPAYMVPRKVVAVSVLPMNANGKIDRNRLMEEL